MSGYKLENGYVLDDEEIVSRAQKWEDSTWEGGLVELQADGLHLPQGTDASLSFKCSQSGADLIERAAAAQGVKKSVFVRDAALEKAVRILATA